MGAITISGGFQAFSGIGQEHFNWPVREDFHLGRSSGHLGNPIALGSFLVLTFPVAMGVMVALVRPKLSRLRWTAIAATLAFLYLYGTQLTLSRGPYLGMAAAIAALVAMSWFLRGRRAALDVGLPIAVAAVGVTVLALGQLTPDDQVLAEGDPAYPRGEPTLGERIVKERTVETRIEIWRASWQLLLARPVMAEQDQMPALVRHMVGYGPETFRYALPFTASPDLLQRLTSEAHNDFIHRAVENGALGLATFLLVLFAAFRVLWIAGRRGRPGRLPVIVTIVIASALAGRVVEQLTGVSRTSDVLIFWVLLGMVVASPLVFGAHSEAGTVPVQRTSSRPPRSPERRQVLASALLVALTFSVAASLLLGLWQKSILYAAADHDATEARRVASTQPDRALDGYDAAINKAADVAKYRHWKSDLLFELADTEPDPFRKHELQRTAYETDLAAYRINPLDRNANFKLAASAWELAKAGELGKAAETVAIYEHLAAIAPAHELVQQRLKALYVATGIEPSVK
jgi:O-antigen ligase